MINITNNEIKFNDLEEKMWKKKMQEGLDELREQLRRIDYQLLKSRNKELLEPKDFQSTTIKCRFGDLDINRRRYKLKKSNNEVEWVYLLDIYLELGYSGEYSQSIVEMVLKEATEKSYRKTAETIEKNTSLNETDRTFSIVKAAIDTVNHNTLYTTKAFENGKNARSILEYSMSDKAAEDRKTVVENLQKGQTLEQASAEFTGDECFEKWYQETKEALEKLIK